MKGCSTGAACHRRCTARHRAANCVAPRRGRLIEPGPDTRGRLPRRCYDPEMAWHEISGRQTRWRHCPGCAVVLALLPIACVDPTTGDGTCSVNEPFDFAFGLEAPPPDDPPFPGAGADPYVAACTVDTVAPDAELHRVAMTCVPAGKVDSEAWELQVGLPAGDAPPLHPGMTVSIDYHDASTFEVGNSRKLRVESNDSPILLAYFETLFSYGQICDGDHAALQRVQSIFAHLDLAMVEDICDATDTLRLDFLPPPDTTSVYSGQIVDLPTSPPWRVAASIATCNPAPPGQWISAIAWQR